MRFFAHLTAGSLCSASVRQVGGFGSSALCVAASGISFYIRFSSFMILHKLIQLDNQREKLTQVS